MTTVAVIGCGRISDLAHFPALMKLDNVRIKYACDLIEEKAYAAKEKFPKIENVITDYKVALNDKEVDAVFVLTPNYAHYEVTMDALKAGKHVLCEKPITVAVMGCVVNGPGEARDADFGIAGGKGEGLYLEHGQTMFKLPQDKWVDFLIEKINNWKKDN